MLGVRVSHTLRRRQLAVHLSTVNPHAMFRKISLFISAIKSELKKSSWPWESDPKVKGFRKYRELWSSTLVVLIAMVLLGAYVAFFDFVMARVVTWAVEQLS